MASGTVTSLHLHPIKSCRPVEVTAATVSATGLAGDREWQIASGLAPVTQRQRSVLATVQPEPIADGLRLSATGRPTIEVERPTATDTVTGSLVGVKVDVGDAGDEAARWFSDLLGDEVRLVARTADSVLRIPEAIDVFDQTIAFTDVAPVLVANTASHRWLAERASEPFGIERFRANVVVATDEPFVEDTWRRFRLGDAVLRHGLIWPRCAVPQVDQETGERHREPAVVLKGHRWCGSAPALPEAVRPIVENKGIFGVGCSIGPVGAEISVGDELIVDETMKPLMPSPATAGR
ncbi:MAG: MOSC domain-containing protein [Acidimicrobiia bacterium]|nr:MOSC domain-containing protein [Acidimicrobiia bacterium]